MFEGHHKDTVESFRVCALGVCAAFALLSGAAAAQSEQAVEVDIEAQDLSSALTTFGRQTKTEIAFTPGVVDSKKAPAVKGEMTRVEVLETLLADSSLEYHYMDNGTVIVRSVVVSEPGDTKSGKLRPASSQVLMAQNQTSEVQSQSTQTNQTNDDEDEAPLEIEQIIVTGSRIRGAQSASPIVTITRQEIDQAGFATVEEIIEKLPQNFGAGASSDANNPTNTSQSVGGAITEVGNFAGGTSVNLRGLGASSTLVLLNGRRMSPSGARAGFTNIGSIPVTAIERVEVMTDGASAIYGSDAIGGVVNFILREHYEGVETRVRYGSDAGGDTSNIQFGQSFGKSWDSGNVLFTYEYYDSDGLAASDRTFTASNDLSPFGGTDRRLTGGNPANIRVTLADGTRVFYAIPAGQDGTALTSADFVGLENTQNRINAFEFTNVIPATERHSGFLYLTQTVGTVELFGAARFSTEETTSHAAQPAVDFASVTTDNPWFVDPSGTGLTSVRVDNYALTDDFGPGLRFGDIDSYGATVGARFDFSDNWSGELAVNWSEEEAAPSRGNVIDTAALAATVNLTDPNQAFNPFGDGANTNPAVIQSLVLPNTFQPAATNDLRSASLDINGDTFEMSGGTVKVAAGIDYREESLISESFTTPSRTELSRDILAVYAEVFMPLVSDANGRAGMRRLEVSVAARYEDYSDFGDSTNPKLGILWSPTESLNLRGTIGTSYRAPSLDSLNDTRSSPWFYIPDLFVGTPFLLQLGRNSELQEEEATTWTAGFQWTPKSVDGLFLDITYFNVDFTGRIETPAVDAFAAFNDPRFASIRIDNPTPEQLAALVNHPNYEPDRLLDFGLGPYPAADIISGAVPVGAIFDNRKTNLAQSVVTGAELQLAYAFDTDVGSFNIGLNGSYLFDFERTLLSTDPLVDEVDTIGRPVDLRARGDVSWNRDRWTVAGYVNYTDGYTDNGSSPARAVDSWTTVDLTIAFDTGENKGFLSDTRLSLTTQNLFDEDPPFVDTLGGVGYDATNANPLGQFFSLQITKNW